MAAVREMTVFMRVPVSEFDEDEFSSDAEIMRLDKHVRVTETYREVDGGEPGAHWSNRDGDTLDARALIDATHLVQVNVTWVDEFDDEEERRWNIAHHEPRDP